MNKQIKNKIPGLLLVVTMALLMQVPAHAQSDDFESNTNTSGRVDVNGSATGEIETARDRDWFAVDLTADKTYTIDIEGSDTDAGTLRNPILRRIRDAEGNVIPNTRKSRGGERRNPRFVFTAEQTATYYIVVRGRRTLTGTYTVKVTDSTAIPEEEKARETSATPPPGNWTRDSLSEPVDGDFSENNMTTGELDVGGYVTAAFEDNMDVDGFKINLEAGKRYRIDVWVKSDFDFGNGGNYGDYTDSSKGRPKLEIRNFDTSGTLADGKLFRLNRYSDPNDDGNPDNADENSVTGADDVSHNVTNVGGSPGNGARVEFDVETTGDYLIKVTADSSLTGENGTYTVLAADITSEGNYNGHFTSGQNSGRLKIDDDDAMTGTIEEESDSDWYTVLLEKEKCYAIHAKANASDDGTLGNPEIRLMKFYDYYGYYYHHPTPKDTDYYEAIYIDPENFNAIGRSREQCSTVMPEDGTNYRMFCSYYYDYNSGTGNNAKIEVEVKDGGEGDYLIGIEGTNGSVGTYSIFAEEFSCPN